MKIELKNNSPKYAATVFGLVGIFIFQFIFSLHATQAANEFARQIELSAYIVNGENIEIPNGQYDIRFSIYSSDRENFNQGEGSAVWRETQSIEIVDGFLNALIGASVPLPEDIDFAENSYYLGVKIGSDSEMVPRKKIGSVSLAINALNAASLSGAVIGEEEGDIPVLGNGGKIDASIISEITELGAISAGSWEADVISSGFGGTGSSTVGLSGAVAYSDGSKYVFSSQGTAGQVLVSGGAGAPTWGSVSGGLIVADSLNFTEFADSLLLDADTNIDTNGFTLGVVGNLDLAGNLNVNSGNLFVDTATGYVGVGTATPNSKLDILDVAVTTGNILALGQNTSAFSGNMLYANMANGSGSFTGDFLDFNVDSVNKFKVDASGNGYFAGNVGIGDTTPDHKLDVAGNIGLDTASYINFGYTDGLAGYGFRDNSGVIEYKNSAGSWTSFGSLSQWTTTGSDIYYSAGRVGIGTTTPETDFEIASEGSIAIQYNTTYHTTPTGGGWFIGRRSRGTMAAPSGVLPGDNLASLNGQGYTSDGAWTSNRATIALNASEYWTSTATGTNITFFTTDNGTTSKNEKMRIESNGYVGIGDTTPDHMLDVAGNIGLDAASYINFGDTDGETGYGLRDNTGTIEYKNSAGVWTGFGGGSSQWTTSGSDIYYNTGNVGIGTISPEFLLTLGTDGGILAIGNEGLGSLLTTEGAGTRLIWYPAKAAFRSGTVDSTQWDDINIGNGSVAMGNNTKASGYASFAIGNGTSATGDGSFSMGGDNTASGWVSTALGHGTSAGGDGSFAAGLSSGAGGSASVAMGNGAIAMSDNSFAFGEGISNNNPNSFMVGFVAMPNLFVHSAGVSIGSENNMYALDVNGEPAANGYTQFTNYSDQRLKENINPLGAGYLDKIMQLNPSSFNYNELSGYDVETRSRTINGFIAQELQLIFPEMVGTVSIDGTDYLDTNLSALPIYLTKAVQEQQVQISDVTLKTDTSISSLTDLQNSIDTQLGVVSVNLSTITKDQNIITEQISNFNDQIGVQTRLIASLQDNADVQTQDIASLRDLADILQAQMIELQAQIATPVDIAQIDLNTQDISYLKILLGIDPENPGSINLVGQLSAEGVETGKLIIKIIDTESPTIGTGKILVGETKSVVKTKAIGMESEVFVTLKNIITDQQPVVMDKDEGVGFTVEVKNPAEDDIEFSWWIVEAR